MELADRVALVTGAGHGIGAAISRSLATSGADIVLVGRSIAPLDETARQLRSLGRRTLVVTGDVSIERTAVEALEGVMREFGRLDILVNNAGIEGPIADLCDITLEDWESCIAVNLRSVFLFCKHAIPAMKRGGAGSIVNISSLLGLKGLKRRTAYCSSKWAMRGLSRALADELGPDNIRVNTVCPGAVEGGRIERVLRERAHDHSMSYDEMRASIEAATPLRRLIAPDEIAEVVRFLCTDAASGITGEEVLVSGGRR